MTRSNLFISLLVSASLIGCGDDVITNPISGGTPGTEAPAGPAYEAEVEVTGGPVAGSSSGTATDGAEGQYFATVAGGLISLWLATDQLVLTAIIDTNGGEVPGTFDVSAAPEGTNFTATDGTAILEGTSGSITVSYCPNDIGAVAAGTLNNIAMIDLVTQGDGGTVSGDYRATVVTSDGSVSCVVPTEPDPPVGGTCDLDESACTGPVCPYEAAIAMCVFSDCLSMCMDVTNPTACLECSEQCVADSGILDDPAAMSAYEALANCEEQADCPEPAFEDEGVSDCMKENCCAELAAAYN